MTLVACEREKRIYSAMQIALQDYQDVMEKQLDYDSPYMRFKKARPSKHKPKLSENKREDMQAFTEAAQEAS
jgi:hypothetical protein